MRPTAERSGSMRCPPRQSIAASSFGRAIVVADIRHLVARRAGAARLVPSGDGPARPGIRVLRRDPGVRSLATRIARAYDPDKNARLFKRPLSRAEIGCYLSHHALWDRVGSSRDAGAIILEDDFDADDALPALLDEICGMDLVELPGQAPFAEEGEGRDAGDADRRLPVARARQGSRNDPRLCRRASRRRGARRQIPSVRATCRYRSQTLVGFRRLGVDCRTRPIAHSDGGRRRARSNPRAKAPSPPAFWADGSAWFATCAINGSTCAKGFERAPKSGRS